ncbi:MAG: carbohydrate ABC transporter permease [Pseudomonadota bacterium]
MKRDRWVDHLVLLFGVFVFLSPLVILFLAAFTPGGLRGSWVGAAQGLSENLANLARVVRDGPGLIEMTLASTRLALGVATLTTLVSFLAAYAMTHFARGATRLSFALVLLTLYFPIEARMLPTFDVAATLGLIDSLAGAVLPILPLAVGTFYIRQHLLTLPHELAEAAQLDAAGPFRFLVDIVLPASLVPLATVFIVSFILGWNQYLWPLMIFVDNAEIPLMRGFSLVGSGSGASMVIAVASLGVPLVLMLLLVRLLARRQGPSG